MIVTDFYVYEHRRVDTGAVFYVGKGRGYRARTFSNRGKWWDKVVKKANGLTVHYPVVGVDEEFALFAEMELIDVYRKRGIKLVNISDGGEGTTGWVPSEETRRKIGEANKHTPKTSGERHGMFGKKHSLESRAKMSESRKGMFAGDRHPMFGKKHTAETKEKISAAKKGQHAGDKNPFYGKTHSKETIERIANSNRGRKASEETRAKQKQSALASAASKQRVRPVICLTNGIRYYGLNDAARKLNLHRQCIRMVCNGKLKQTGGHVFKWSEK